MGSPTILFAPTILSYIHRITLMVEAMEHERVGNYSNQFDCAKARPKSIPVSLIARLNHKSVSASLFDREHGKPVHHPSHEE